MFTPSCHAHAVEVAPPGAPTAVDAERAGRAAYRPRRSEFLEKKTAMPRRTENLLSMLTGAVIGLPISVIVLGAWILL